MSRATILDAAKKIVCGAREEEYSSPENSFAAIAELWNAFLFNKIHGDEITFRITSDDVGLMMALFKIARVQTGRYKADSFIDACGYLACAGEIAEEKQEEMPFTEEEMKCEEK